MQMGRTSPLSPLFPPSAVVLSGYWQRNKKTLFYENNTNFQALVKVNDPSPADIFFGLVLSANSALDMTGKIVFHQTIPNSDMTFWIDKE